MSGYVANNPKGYRNKGVEPVDIGEQRWAEYKDLPTKPEPKPDPIGCVFAKSCTLPDGVINHSNPGGFVPVESLKQYGTYAVMGTGQAISASGTVLQWIGGSDSAAALLARLRGTLALAGPATAVGFAALLLPDDTSADSAFYTSEQYAQLSQGNTRVRVNVKHLPDGSVSAYGFYTGTKAEWQQVPVVEAKARGDQLVADIGNGIEVIWTPAADPNAVLGIPALEGASLKPGAWVYPPTEQADKILVNPEHPADYHDAIIWFPSQPNVAPIYLSVSTQLEKNKAAGAAFEEDFYSGFSEEMEESGQQVTVKTGSGTKTRLDMIGRDTNGKIACVECKASETAPLTRNQKLAFPEIEESGGVIVGKGKPGFPGGTVLPPTRVDIIRPGTN